MKRKYKILSFVLVCTFFVVAIFIPIPIWNIPENAVVWKRADPSDSYWYPGHELNWREVKGNYEQIKYQDAQSQGLVLAPGMDGRAEYPPIFFTLWYIIEDQEMPVARWVATGENIPTNSR